MKRTIKIAGVTFCNTTEYGGRHRQTILKEFYQTKDGIITVDLKRVIFLNPDTHQYEPAIQCIEHTTKQLIGWIPKTEIQYTTQRQMTGFILFYKNTYSVRLNDQIAPSPAQYKMVKQICQQQHLVMPAYDVRAYVKIFQLIRTKG